jgi:hypothetical protein
MDQASGLRQRVLQRSGARESIEVPLIRAHIRVTGTESIEVPSGSLIWHWRPTARAATGWDLQARFHVCGLPNQIQHSGAKPVALLGARMASDWRR